MARNRLGLTRFQHASVRLYVAGYSQKEIALLLNLSEGTIGCHIDKARSNLGVGTRFELFREILKRAGVPDVPALVDKAAGV